MATERIRARGLEFEVDVREGAGDTGALLLHGFPQSSASWGAVGDALAARGVTTWAPNQRGYSPGARPGRVRDYHLDELVADVIALCDELSLEAAHLVGHDWGAIVSWATAARHPGRVASLTAVSVPHPAAFARALAEDPEQREKSGYIEHLVRPGSEDLLTADGAAGLRLGYGDAVTPEIADRHIARLLEPGAMRAALNWYRAIGDAWATVPPVSTPSTLVWGAGDMAVARSGIDLCARFVHADLEVVVLEDRGHWLPEEAPGELTAAITARMGLAHKPFPPGS